MTRAAVVQFQHRPGDKDYNLSRIRHFCVEAARQGVELLSFPEMCVTGYWHIRHLDRAGIATLAEPVPDGPSTSELRRLATEHQIVIGAGLIEQDENGAFYNAYVVCDCDGTVHHHHKLHCFISEHMSSGDDFTVFDCSLGFRLGILICYDNNLIENARATALRGAHVLLAPHQTGGVRSRSPHAMGAVDPGLWKKRGENPEAIEAEFKGEKGRGWLMRWLPSRAHDNGDRKSVV